MFTLRDFFHLPQLETYVEQIANADPGLTVIAGLDPRPVQAERPGEILLPSGRSSLFGILLNEVLAARPTAKCLLVTRDKAVVRIPRELRGRIELAPVTRSESYAKWISAARQRRPDWLVIDHLTPENAELALEAAQEGLPVLVQLDSVFRGAGVARQLRDQGIPSERLAGMAWVLAVQRLPALCPECKQPSATGAEQLARLREQHPYLAPWLGEKATFFQPGRCARCQNTGRYGDVAVFDVFKAGIDRSPLLDQASLLPMEGYILRLATLGRLCLEDFTRFETEQLHRTFNLFTSVEQSLTETNQALERELVQLRAAYRVLQQRNEALISLQDIGQALIASTGLADLAERICRHARDLCGADRAMVYTQPAAGRVTVLAAAGWPTGAAGQEFAAEGPFGAPAGPEPVPFNGYPPGVTPLQPDPEPPRAGLWTPLYAQDQPVGWMVVHTTRKARFEPGERALLQTYANQAAVALQRGGLVEELRAKIAQLEAAQAELAQKERMERELELARQVQQSVLPTTFPQVTGFQFAAQNEPARQVGGDFYDVIDLDPEHFGLAIADVSDKGMPAALYMTLARSLLRAEAYRERSPQAVVRNVNRLLLELGEPDLFLTLFYGVVERSTHRLTYTRAGHEYPLLLRKGTAQELGGQGPPLGVFADDEFQPSEEALQLLPGDRLVLFTDGLSDVLLPDGKLLGHGALIELLKSYADLPANRLCAAVFEALNAQRGDGQQFDDMTLLVLGVDSPGG